MQPTAVSFHSLYMFLEVLWTYFYSSQPSSEDRHDVYWIFKLQDGPGFLPALQTKLQKWQTHKLSASTVFSHVSHLYPCFRQSVWLFQFQFLKALYEHSFIPLLISLLILKKCYKCKIPPGIGMSVFITSQRLANQQHLAQTTSACNLRNQDLNAGREFRWKSIVSLWCCFRKHVYCFNFIPFVSNF